MTSNFKSIIQYFINSVKFIIFILLSLHFIFSKKNKKQRTNTKMQNLLVNAKQKIIFNQLILPNSFYSHSQYILNIVIFVSYLWLPGEITDKSKLSMDMVRK